MGIHDFGTATVNNLNFTTKVTVRRNSMNNKDIQSLNKRLRLVVTNAYLTKATSTNVLDVDDKANTISTSYTYDINTGNKLSATDGRTNLG